MIKQTKTLIALAAAGLALTGAVAHADNDKDHHYDKNRSHNSRGHAYGRYNAGQRGNNGNHFGYGQNNNGNYGQRRDNDRNYSQHRDDNDRVYSQHRDDNDRVYSQRRDNDNQGQRQNTDRQGHHRDDNH